MRTFSVAEQTVTHSDDDDGAMRLEFGIPTDDTSKVSLRVTYDDGSGVTFHFNRNGLYERTDTFDAPDSPTKPDAVEQHSDQSFTVVGN